MEREGTTTERKKERPHRTGRGEQCHETGRYVHRYVERSASSQRVVEALPAFLCTGGWLKVKESFSSGREGAIQDIEKVRSARQGRCDS